MMILSEKDLQLLSSMSNQNITSEADSSFKDNELKIEFDGTTVLCRVCGDRASGFHYGVHSCEGCKGFFRRSIQQKIQYRPCTKNQQCSILRINRNRCQYCRLKKCIAVGMSRDAVRFGRVPKREKAKILAAMQKVNQNSQEKQLTEQLEDESRLLMNILQAHEETCDYTKEKVAPLIEKARKNPVYASCPLQMACPLNPLPQSVMDNGEGILEDFSERFSPAIRGVVEFAKRIPGFGMLSQDDQVTLLKAGVFEVLLVRLACMFDKQTNSMICLNGMVLKRESLHSQSSARFLLDSMFGFAEMLNALNLTDHEIALFCAVVVISPDRPGLRNTDLVQKIHRKLDDLLQKAIISNHSDNPGLFTELKKKIPDLRTLNTLHSEKLLAYKMGPKNGQQNNCVNNGGAIGVVGSSSGPGSGSSSSNSSTSSITSNGIDRNCGSPGSTCSYASLLPAQWQNFSLRDTDSAGPRSASRSGCPSEAASPVGTPCDWSESGKDDVEGGSFGSPRSYGSSVTSSGNVVCSAKSPPRPSSVSSANGIGCYSPTSDHHNQNNHHHSSQSPSSQANHFILGQRLLQAASPHHNSNKSHQGLHSGLSRECPMSTGNLGRYTELNNHLNSNNTSSNNNNSIHHNSMLMKNGLDNHRLSSEDVGVISSYYNNSESSVVNSNKKSSSLNSVGQSVNSDSVFTKIRRVDSPTDSGIESGKEQCNGSTPTTSVCSSPRSAMDDKVKDIVSDSESGCEKPESIDDMPMLKRALQAPPLINTNMLMDEAYRHHKKFRATKASRDCEPASSSTSIMVSSVAPSPLNSHNSSNSNSCNSISNSLASPTSTSSSSSLSSTSSISSPTSNCDSLASTHSTLVKVLEQAPRYVGDLSPHHHSHHHLTSHHQQNHYSSSLHSPVSRHLLTSSSPPHHLGSSSPSPTPLKRTDLIHNIITKDGPVGSGGEAMPPPLDLSRKRDLLYL